MFAPVEQGQTFHPSAIEKSKVKQTLEELQARTIKSEARSKAARKPRPARKSYSERDQARRRSNRNARPKVLKAI